MEAVKRNKAIGVIPARYESTRFPGKPLADIAGKTMIRRVYENASKASALSQVIVATDDERIVEEVKSFGGEVVMTSPTIRTGTERVAKAVETGDAEIILNIQGDEPLVPPGLLDRLVDALIKNESIPVCTPVVKIQTYDDLVDPNQVRVVFDNNLHALYFTRAAAPFNRDNGVKENWFKQDDYWKHIGIYCFRRDFLFEFVKLPEGKLEKIEKLEQLRILENGHKILIVKTDYSPVCVDVPEDILKVEEKLTQ